MFLRNKRLNHETLPTFREITPMKITFCSIFSAVVVLMAVIIIHSLEYDKAVKKATNILCMAVAWRLCRDIIIVFPIAYIVLVLVFCPK